MSHSWLQRKRKGELLELAQKAGIADSDGLLKDDLVERLEERLNASETTYAKHPEFRDYYGRSGSPVKRERSSPSDALTVTKARRRTLVKVPSEEPTPVKDTAALVTRTPRAIARRVSEVLSEVDIPASPAHLADVAENQIEQIKGKATELWDRTRIDYFKELLRENASSVATIQTLILLIEATGLQWNTLQTTPTVKVPQQLEQYTSNQYVFVPDFLALLTSEWWAPATLWSLTSWVLPLIVSYFFNLTLRSNTQRKSSDRQYPADPFTFNIIKAILVYTAYQYPSVDASLVSEPGIVQAHDLSWGPFSSATVGAVRNNVPGGYYGLQIGALVGVLVSLYDAALKK